jgi:type II secretory pathway pseudopilin PulG
MQSETKKRAHQEGYNLVEVLVALAVTGVVIISVISLFFMGQKNVYSGKQLTAANAVATRVLEDLSLLTAYDVLSNFGISDTTARTSNSIEGQTFASSVLRGTNLTIDSTTDPGGYLARWQTIANGSGLTNGRVTLVITPANPVDGTKPASTAQVVRVRGFVQWREFRRNRSVTFDSTKLQRP